MKVQFCFWYFLWSSLVSSYRSPRKNRYWSKIKFMEWSSYWLLPLWRLLFLSFSFTYRANFIILISQLKKKLSFLIFLGYLLNFYRSVFFPPELQNKHLFILFFVMIVFKKIKSVPSLISKKILRLKKKIVNF